MGHIGRYNKLEPTLVLRATVPIAVSLGIVFFPLCWVAYGDIVGGYTYPGLIARILGARVPSRLSLWPSKCRLGSTKVGHFCTFEVRRCVGPVPRDSRGHSNSTCSYVRARPRHNVAHASERVDEDDEWMGPTWVEKELKSGFERNRGCIPGDRRKRC